MTAELIIQYPRRHMIRYKRIVPITANGAQNAYNPLPNGNGVPVAPVNTTAANPPPPPPPPPQPEPEKNLVVDWNGPGG
ncbi:hypothetical protein FRC19_006512 [Serendipita sp. 401]|nr:hypothetical protein FRC19_006512 [Serendipita sp. 401]